MSSKELIVGFSNELFPGVVQLIERSRQKAALFLNTEKGVLYADFCSKQLGHKRTKRTNG